MSRGAIWLHRQIREHWLWKDKPFSKGQAWIDMLMLANHATIKIPYRDKTTEIHRGEFIRSIRDLAIMWGWSRMKTQRFIILLKNDLMIDQKAGQLANHIKIINYDSYQPSKMKSGTVVGQQWDSSGTVVGLNNNVKNVKNDKNKERYSVSFLKFWDFYLGKNKGSKLTAFKSWNKNGHPDAESLIEMHRKQGDQKRELKENGEFSPEWPHISTYLNQARWEETFEREKGSDTGNAKTFLEYLDNQGNYIGPED